MRGSKCTQYYCTYSIVCSLMCFVIVLFTRGEMCKCNCITHAMGNTFGTHEVKLEVVCLYFDSLMHLSHEPLHLFMI